MNKLTYFKSINLHILNLHVIVLWLVNDTSNVHVYLIFVITMLTPFLLF